MSSGLSVRIEGGRAIVASVMTPSHSSGGSAATVEREAAEAIAQGQLIAVIANQFVLANCTEIAKREVVGFAQGSINAAFSGFAQTGGLLSLGNWSAIAGSATLTPGAYYLDALAGRMTATAPNEGAIVRVGLALNSTDFLISIEPPIIL